MGKAEDNKQAKRTRLMDNAFKLFLENGISGTTISDIAKKSGIAKGTFYLYFKDKYDLRDKLIAHRAKLLFEHVLSESGYQKMETSDEKILAIVDGVLFELRKNPRLLKFINKNLSWGVFENALAHSDIDFLSIIADILDKEVEDKELLITVYMVIELIGSSCHSVILKNDPVTLEEYIPYLHKSIVAILHA